MKNHHVFIILCIVCLIAAFSAGCTSPSTPATPAKTTTTVSTAAATPAPTAVVAKITKPATPVPHVTSANGFYTFTGSENKGYYTLPKNSQMFLTLDENPTTGYTWNLTTTPGLTIVKDEFLPPTSSQGLGAGGMHEWEIKTAAEGDQQISAVLKHVSDPVTGRETTYTVFIEVE